MDARTEQAYGGAAQVVAPPVRHSEPYRVTENAQMSLSTEVQGAGPQLFPIKALHRHDGYIAFALKNGDDFRPAFSIRADALDSIFPEFRLRLLKDSFVSLNGSYCLANRQTGKVHGPPRHRNDSLRYLCACYADLDFYKLGMTFNETMKAIMDLCEARALPWASMVVNSGRGMWLLWLLHDEKDSAKAHYGAWDDNPNDHYRLYAKINEAIGQRLMQLGADAIARDGARYCRVPGSFRTDEEAEVSWWIQGRGNCAYTYTLKELASFFEITRVVFRPPQEREALMEARKKCGNRSKGWLAAARNSLAAFVTLMDLRGGGFDEGRRNHAAFVYTRLLHRNSVSRADTRKALAEMAAQCRPPLIVSACDATIRGVYKYPRGKCKISYHIMADTLDIIPEEAEAISQVIGRPFPAAVRFGKLEPMTTQTGGETRVTKQVNRRERIMAIIQAKRVIPSYRAMKTLLYDLGIETSHITIKADYEALGLVSDGRANRCNISATRSQQPVLPLSAAC